MRDYAKLMHSPCAACIVIFSLTACFRHVTHYKYIKIIKIVGFRWNSSSKITKCLKYYSN